MHEIQIVFLYETVVPAHWKFNCQSIYLLLYYTVIIYRLSTVELQNYVLNTNTKMKMQ